MTASIENPIVVLGAGVCGLYGARILAKSGVPVVVIDKNKDVGGLASGQAWGKNFIDLGVHHLHAHDQEIFDDLKDLMAETLIPCQKIARVRYGKGHRRYPLEFFDLITGIPWWFLGYALLGMIYQQLKNRLGKKEAENAEEALIELYGSPLYRHFFRDFTHKYWGVPPDKLSASFVRRKMPRLSAINVIKSALGKIGLKEKEDASTESATRDETIWFSAEGSRMMPRTIARKIEEQGGQILCSHELKRVVTEGSKVVAVVVSDGKNEQTIPCSACLSTIPLNLLVRAMITDTKAPILAEAAALQFRQIAVYGILVNKESLLDALYIYYRNRSFTRISEPSRSGMQVQPAGHTILLVEMTCAEGDSVWEDTKSTRELMLSELEEEGILRRSDVVEIFSRRELHGYPIFKTFFENHLEQLQNFIGGFDNLKSTGRQGAFCYPNMHQAMRMGWEAAEQLDLALCKQ